MSDPNFTTAEINRGVSLMTGEDAWTFTVTTDRRHGARGLTKGKWAGRVVANTLPGLLRDVATLAEQGDGTLDCVADALRAVSQ